MKDNKLALSDSFCCYMDIIGFEDKVEEAYKNGKEQELLEKLYRVIKSAPTLLNGITPMSMSHKYRIFSDNLVFGFPMSKGFNNQYNLLMTFVSLYQFRLVADGFFVRGGLALGSLYIGKEFVYGKALLDAYKLESKYADKPRIVISESIVQVIKKRLEASGNQLISDENKDILIDTDNQYFINYLGITVGHTYIHWDWIKLHKKSIEFCLKVYKSDSKILSKYIWVANYHNYFCKLLKKFPGYDKSYLINSKVSLSKPRMLLGDYIDFWL